MRPLRILVGTPLPHQARTPAVSALQYLRLQSPGPLEFRQVAGYQVDQNRERLAEAALESGATHLLFLDLDVWPPQDVIPRLLRWHHPVTSGAYWGRAGHLTAGKWAQEGPPHWDPAVWPPPPQTIMDVCGLGCALIDTRVFPRLSRPWFRFLQERGVTAVSEDTWFCQKLKEELGLNVFVDSSALCRHQLDAWVLPGGVAELTQPADLGGGLHA